MAAPAPIPPTRIDASYRNLERVVAWIGNADNKAYILLTFQGAVLAALGAASGELRHSISSTSPGFQVALWLLLAILAIAFVACCINVFLVIRPDMDIRSRLYQTPSLFYFATVAGMPRETFVQRICGLDDADIELELAEQTHINSTIALNKFVHLRRGMRAMFATIVMLLLIALVDIAAPQHQSQTHGQSTSIQRGVHVNLVELNGDLKP